MAMKYRYVSKNGKYKIRWRPGPVDAIMMAHRAKPTHLWQCGSRGLIIFTRGILRRQPRKSERPPTSGQ
jgi:hypothetical protein